MTNPIFTESNPVLAAMPGLGINYSAKEARQAIAISDAGSVSGGSVLGLVSATVTTASAEVLAADTDRKLIVLQNLGTDPIWLGFGVAAAVDTGLRLQSYEIVELDSALFATSQITAISTGASVPLTIYTGT